jgi:hypothetical protein
VTATRREHLESAVDGLEPSVRRQRRLLAEDRVAEDRRATVVGNLARDARKLGFYHALLGDDAASRSWFETAVARYREQARLQRERSGDRFPAPALYHGLVAALLLGDDAAEKAFCSRLGDVDARAAEAGAQVVRLALARDLCGLLADAGPTPAGDRERVERLFDRGVCRYDDVDRRPLHRAEFACADALAAGDADGARAAVEEILEFHRNAVVTDDHLLATDYYSVEATLWMGLARRLGVDAAVESRYVPAHVVDQMA